MRDFQMSLAEQLSGFYQGMQSRMAPADLEALRNADLQMVADKADQTMLQPGEPAPGFSLVDQNGIRVSLADRLAVGPVVLLFIRGGWCPFCTLQLRAWQDALPRLHDAGGDLLTVSPQRADACSRCAERDLLAYSVLSDPGGDVAESYRVMVELPEVVRPLYLRLGHDLPRINGTGTWRLPMAATFILAPALDAPNGRIAMAHADLELSKRCDPDVAIQAVRRLTGA